MRKHFFLYFHSLLRYMIVTSYSIDNNIGYDILIFATIATKVMFYYNVSVTHTCVSVRVNCKFCLFFTPQLSQMFPSLKISFLFDDIFVTDENLTFQGENTTVKKKFL